MLFLPLAHEARNGQNKQVSRHSITHCAACSRPPRPLLRLLRRAHPGGGAHWMLSGCSRLQMSNGFSLPPLPQPLLRACLATGSLLGSPAALDLACSPFKVPTEACISAYFGLSCSQSLSAPSLMGGSCSSSCETRRPPSAGRSPSYQSKLKPIGSLVSSWRSWCASAPTQAPYHGCTPAHELPRPR